MKKLVNLSINHIAGVDKPANKRSFLIIKQEKKNLSDAEVQKVASDLSEVIKSDYSWETCVEDRQKDGYDEESARKIADALEAKGKVAKQMSIKKEGDKYCLYDGDQKLGEYDTMEEATAAKEKQMTKGAAMLTKEQIAKISDKGAQEAAIALLENVTALEKKNEQQALEIARLEKGEKGGGGSSDNGDDETVWKGVPPAIRNRFEAIKKERDDMAKKAKDERDQRETGTWVQKCRSFKYLSVTPEQFGKVLKSVAESCPTEADEIYRVLSHADDVISKGAIFSEIGKSGRNGESNPALYDATNVTARVMAMAEDYMKLDKALSYPEALSKVFKEKPDWHDGYRKENAARV